MNPRAAHHRLLPDWPESLAPSGRGPWAAVLWAVLVFAWWLTALGFVQVDATPDAGPATVQSPSASVTFCDRTVHASSLAAPDEQVAEPTETRLADLLTADMDGSDAERFPARSHLPRSCRRNDWSNSVDQLADHGRVDTLLRPPDA